MKKKFVSLFAAIAMLFAAVATAPPAFADATDGYDAATCSVSGGGVLHASNYPVSGGGQEYHLDLNSGSSVYPVALYFNGTRLASWNEVYVYRAVRSSKNDIKGQWRSGVTGNYYTCTINDF